MKLMTTLQLESLKEFGERLLADNHFDSKNIKKQLDHIVRRQITSFYLLHKHYKKIITLHYLHFFYILGLGLYMYCTCFFCNSCMHKAGYFLLF